MPLSYFKTQEQTLDVVNPNLPVVKLSTSGKSALGGSAIVNHILPENAGGTSSIGSHVGADNSRIFNTKTDVVAKMALLFNSHGGYVTPNFGQAVTAPGQPFNFAGIALTPTQAVSDNWNQKQFSAGVLPPPRDLFGMSYIEFNQKVLIFGGENNGSVSSDTWTWDGTTWVQILPLAFPTARRNFSMTYDSNRKVVVLFGGIDGTNTPLSDTWEFNGTNWSHIITAHFPSARSDYAMKFDSSRNKTVLFGGKNGTALYDDTWEYNGTDWTQIGVGGTFPSIRFQPAIAFDSSRNKTILFGGIGVSATTTIIFPTGIGAGDSVIGVGSTAGFPSAGTLIIDAEYISYTSITATSFKGCTRGVYNTTAALHSSFATVSFLISLGDTWEYNGSTWTQIFLAGTLPSPRSGSKLVYNSTKKIAILFAGVSNPGANTGDLSDTWQYDGNSWTQLNIFGPSPRENFGMTYDSNRDKIVLFGGQNTSIIGANGETWEFGSPLRPVVVQTTGDGLVYYDSSPGRPVPVIGDFLGPSSEIGTVTPLYDGYTPVFGVALEPPVLLSTILSADVNSIVTTIPVSSTVGFPGVGTVTIDSEQINYTGTTPTTLTGCTRGVNSTTAASHVANTIVFSTIPLQLTVNGATVGIIKMRIRPFYGFIPAIPPSITNFAPNQAIVGSTVTVTGSVFIGTTQVTINDAYSTNATFSVISNDQLTFTVPAGGQEGTITVTNAQGNSTSSTRFSTVPTITSVFAASFAVGSTVQINGHTFQYTTGVKFNGISATYSIINDGYVTAVIPVGGTTGNIVLTITYPSTNVFTATYNNFSVVAPPIITNVAPLTGPIGAAAFTTLSTTISSPSSTANIVVASTTGFLTSGFIIIDSEQIAYTGTTGGNTFTGITRAINGTVGATHTSGVAVNSGVVNPTGYVSVTGSGFAVHGSGYDGYGLVQFVDVATMTQILNCTRTVFNDTTISLIVPNPNVAQPSTAYYVRVITDGGTVTSVQQFTIIPIPKFLNSPGPTFIPSSGVAGDLIRIFGDYGFTGVSSVRFDGYATTDGYASPSIAFVNDGYITAIVPSVASTTDVVGPISVTSTGGTKNTHDSPATAPLDFTITQSPTITSFSPSSGKTGDTVVLLGSNLLGVSSVSFTGESGSAAFSIVNGGRINITVPAAGSGITQAPSLCNITIVKGPFHPTSSGTFLYYPPPTITSYSPAADSGGISGGDGISVTISGTNLTQGGTPSVSFGGIAATVTSAAPGTVIATVTAGSGSGISLTTSGGTATSSWTYLAPPSISSFYTDWPYDHHSATPYYPSIIDVYGSNFRPSPFMQVVVNDPALGYEVITVPFTFHDSTHITFDAGSLGAFSGGDTCYIQIYTFFPSGSYYTYVYGLYLFYPII